MNATVTASLPLASAFTVPVIHDLRNALATIRASSEILARSGLPAPQVQRLARNMQDASVRMQDLLAEVCGPIERNGERCDQ